MSFLLAISVGNTRTAVGHFHGEDLHVVQHLANGDVPAIVAAAVAQWEHKGEHDGEVVIASVNDALATAIEAKLASELHTDIWRIGRDIEDALTQRGQRHNGNSSSSSSGSSSAWQPHRYGSIGTVV
jgi:pantothenate kinase type III